MHSSFFRDRRPRPDPHGDAHARCSLARKDRNLAGPSKRPLVLSLIDILTAGVFAQWAEDGSLKLELNDQERRAVARSLAERKSRLIESAGDTTQTRAARRSAMLELDAIVSVSRKLRSGNRLNSKVERDLDDELPEDFDR
jgi:hypothetical protein